MTLALYAIFGVSWPSNPVPFCCSSIYQLHPQLEQWDNINYFSHSNIALAFLTLSLQLMHLAALSWPSVGHAFGLSRCETQRNCFFTQLISCDVPNNKSESVSCFAYRLLITDTILGLSDITLEVNGEPSMFCNAATQVLPLRMLNYGAPCLFKTNLPPQSEASASHGHQASAQNLLVWF